MGVTTFKDANGKYWAKGMPAISKVGIFFGIIFLIAGVIALFAGSLLSGFVLLPIGNIILFATNRHTGSVQQRKATQALAASKVEKTTEQKEFEEFKKWKEQQDWR